MEIYNLGGGGGGTWQHMRLLIQKNTFCQKVSPNRSIKMCVFVYCPPLPVLHKMMKWEMKCKYVCQLGCGCDEFAKIQILNSPSSSAVAILMKVISICVLVGYIKPCFGGGVRNNGYDYLWDNCRKNKWES